MCPPPIIVSITAIRAHAASTAEWVTVGNQWRRWSALRSRATAGAAVTNHSTGAAPVAYSPTCRN